MTTVEHIRYLLPLLALPHARPALERIFCIAVDFTRQLLADCQLVTSRLVNWISHGLDSRVLVKMQNSHLADWSTRG